MAYPEDLPPEGDLGGAAPSLKSRFSYHLEGLIPLILIIIIVFFLAAFTGVINSSTPIIGPLVGKLRFGEGPASLLVIGTPSRYTMDVLNTNKDLVQPLTIKSAEALERNPEAYLAQYDIVMLDQSAQASKEVSRVLGEAIQKYVAAGGKFILVMDSGIRRPNAPDILGWKASFESIVPVDCSYIGLTNTPSCTQKVSVAGHIYPGAVGVKHEIMRGIEQVPADPGVILRNVQVFDVTITGNEIAYFEDARTHKFYPAIVEAAGASTIIGKSLYFNYDPGITPGLLQETIDYLR